MHREIAARAGFDTDHCDGNGLNNQRHNLRPAARSQNNQNGHKRAACSSKFKGVSWDKKAAKWRAYIRVNAHLRHLGYFQDEQQAATAYNEAAVCLFREFAKTNQIYA